MYVKSFITVHEFETAKEKLNFLATGKFEELIRSAHITPDENHNWINLTDNDFNDLIAIGK